MVSIQIHNVKSAQWRTAVNPDYPARILEVLLWDGTLQEVALFPRKEQEDDEAEAA